MAGSERTGAPDAATDERHIVWLVWEAYQHTRRALDEVLRPIGLTAAQLGMLNRIAEHPGLSGVEVARRMLVTPQAAHLALSTLERKGLIERKLEAGGGHVTRTFLTEEGRRTLASGLGEAHEVERRLVAVLSPDQKSSMADLLDMYVQ